MNNEIVKVEIPVQESRNYPIIIGKNILDHLGEYVKTYSKANKILIITNETIYPLFGEKVKSSLEKENLETEFLILNDGEKYKDIKSLELIWTKAIEYKLERKDAILALGGGVVGDITGFAAATYLRGIDFIQVPTTLLAQVDSSVGGKVAVNHKLGKNLIGAFYQPKLVFTDIETLKTLPVEELKVGLAEVLKYGFIEESCNLKEEKLGLLKYLEAKKDDIFALNPTTIQNLIKYCCQLKAAVVNQDEKEAGLRAILNFGHTIGHAVEKCANYNNFTHGQGVAIGMKGAFYIAKEKGLIAEDYLNSSLNLINLYGLDYKISQDFKQDDLMAAMLVDKKVLSKKIRFVLPASTANVGIFSDIDRDIIYSAIEKLY
ncbi:MAG: 3-dehydroquinate synthase [Candidatus Melainabacteria bacterium RIFOXYA12_FULL_32_12]|nr:MAG: 3-dehydroquinate synthase [Candidatus Melainabacteria bacterium RIFOXYA2_FULL_32_9]OGI30626.1 MAG: 3-dehydroquinate synthase [Candidatus Melainabacteria bacterium RIFOXYA12_FULL_32_12]